MWVTYTVLHNLTDLPVLMKYGVQIYQSFSELQLSKEKQMNLQHHEGEISLSLQTLHDEVELIAQGLEAVRHADLGHVGLTDVVAFWTFLQIVFTQEADFFLEHRIKPIICPFHFKKKKKLVHLSLQTYIVALFLQ